jgi:integrase/recombinase XerD
MAGVHKRKSDRRRGKSGKWTAWWIGEDGKQHQRAAFTDRGRSLELAHHLEAEARRVREGIVEPGERARREAAARPIADHVADYRLDLLAKADGPRHAQHVAGVLVRVLADAGIATVGDLAPDQIQQALGRLRARRSARTCNHALAAVKAFAAWLEHSNRIKESPRGLARIPRYNEEADRCRERRAITRAELDRLLAAAEIGEPVYIYGPTKSKLHKIGVTGPERATLYRLAMGTGFRAEELRTLTPERFALEGPEPTVTVLACYAKSGKEAVQPVTRELAEALRPFVARCAPGSPVVPVPTRTAQMLRVDLAAAGIPYRDGQGRYLDFHALRHSYITHLIRSGANPKVVQALARHSTITLTLDRYTHLEEGDVRGALEGKK